MSGNAAVIEEFYSAFQAKDADRMEACYHEDCTFTDPGFGLLKGDQVGAMWRMLLKSSKDKPLDVTYDSVTADGDTGSAHWEAKYTFGSNPVHNKIDAAFTFKDGKILTHVDVFDFWTWSSQALGLTGKILGWTPFFKFAVKKATRGQLAKFQARQKAKKAAADAGGEVAAAAVGSEE